MQSYKRKQKQQNRLTVAYVYGIMALVRQQTQQNTKPRQLYA
nr:MAG TPA: hypothetical protein [Caudoviricetes sp.]